MRGSEVDGALTASAPPLWSLLGRRPHGKRHPMGCDQAWDAAQVDLGSVLGRQRRHPGWIELTASSKFGDRVEELLEARGRDDLEDAGRRVARIPEGVPLALRLEDEIAHLAVNDLAAEVCPDSTLEDKAVLVLPTVPMHRRCQCAGLHWMLDQREPASGLRAINQEADSDASQFSELSIPGTDDPSQRCCHSLSPFQ